MSGDGDIDARINELRGEIAEAAGKLQHAYLFNEWGNFHFQLGVIYGLVSRLYEANAEKEHL